MVYVASQPIKYQKRKGDGVCSLYFLPFKRVCCCCKDDSVSDGDFTWASSNAIALPSSHSESYKLPKNKKNSKKSKQGIYALEKNGSAKPVKLTHIVIEDGRVRFKSEEDITDNSSELGTSLPDLVNGNVVKEDIYEADTIEKPNNKLTNGVYNVGFNETEGVNYKNEKLTKMTYNQANNNSENRIHKSSIDQDASSIGTFGTDVGRNLSSLNLADSMEFEFEKVYERSFVQDETNSIKSLPNILCNIN
ncbi:hypothetical protein KUTeg_020376 [Tegillarca granosa]|uniref:Uncharacterized protein n=1 Tax=Tegillarca granosa TaxID=220873 RepID=A0ABQ9E7R5_TEGGR|nr:hypothetical protein KUTeg_020376 [Tegillarca granosa]